MDARTKRIVLLAGLLAAAVIGANLAGFGAAKNTEDCLPLGWYVTVPVYRPLRVGDTVVVCPPPTNPVIRFAITRHWITRQQGSVCPDGLTPYIKQVYATPGDTVTITPQSVAVNGVTLPHSTSLPTTADGHTPMPHAVLGTFRIKPGQVFLLGLYAPNAFDGRYFGPLPENDVVRLAYKLP